MTRTDSADKIVARLFDRRKRPVQVSLFWLLMGTTLAPMMIYLATLWGSTILKEAPKILSSPPASERALARASGRQLVNATQAQLSETPLWSDAFALVVFLCLASAWLAGMAMQLLDDHEVKYVAGAIISGCAIVLLIAVVLCFANRAGDTSVLAASGEDYFVVYVAPFALAVALGSAIGGAVAVTR